MRRDGGDNDQIQFFRIDTGDGQRPATGLGRQLIVLLTGAGDPVEVTVIGSSFTNANTGYPDAVRYALQRDVLDQMAFAPRVAQPLATNRWASSGTIMASPSSPSVS